MISKILRPTSAAAALIFTAVALPAQANSELETARDHQDRAVIQRMLTDFEKRAQADAKAADAQYSVALAASYMAEVSLELKDKPQAAQYAEEGIAAGERAVALNAKNAEYYRVLSTLYGQAAAGGNMFAAIKFGKEAQESINKAKALEPNSPKVILAEGVGHYYLPAAFGGGPDIAVQDFQRAVQLDPKSSEAYLWLGLALRKENKNAEARDALAKAVSLNPNRMWAKQQLEKTPTK